MKKYISVSPGEEIEDAEIAYSRLNNAEASYLTEEEVKKKVI